MGLYWNNLEQFSDIEDLLVLSEQQACLIFKHSTRCPLSAMAKQRLERDWAFAERQLRPYYLDVIAHRSLSNQIAADLGVQHESPQALLIHKGRCFFSCSHLEIEVSLLAERLQGELGKRA